MSRIVRWLVIVLLLGAAGYFVWQQTRVKPVEILVKTVTRGTVERVVANTRAGTVKACRRARLSPSIGGQIAKLPVKEGDQVEEGALLLEIWNRDLNAQVVVAEREVEVANAQAEATCQSAEEALRQAKRAKFLYESRIGSQEQTEMAVTESQSLQAQCIASRATVKRSLAQVDLARVNLNRSRLLAPFDGVVAKVEGELNEYVTPSPVGVQTPPAVDLIGNDCFYITAPIDEVDAAAVRREMEARITLDAFDDRVFTGKVKRIAPYVLDLEKQARTVDIEVAFGEKEEITHLLAGYSADVEIILDVRDNVVKVPTEAVMDGKAVFVFSQEGVIRKVPFTPGLRNWAFTEVVSGLAEDMQVVVNVDKPGLKDNIPAVLKEPES